jgi:hypothetical protein
MLLIGHHRELFFHLLPSRSSQKISDSPAGVSLVEQRGISYPSILMVE